MLKLNQNDRKWRINLFSKDFLLNIKMTDYFKESLRQWLIFV